jgi:hypothetical protein
MPSHSLFARTLNRFRLIATFLSFSLAVFAGGAHAQAPFQIREVSFPLIGTQYLDEMPGWTPLPTVVQELKALGATSVKVTLSAGNYLGVTANLPNVANPNPDDAKIVAFLSQLKATGLQITLQGFVNIEFDPNGNALDTVHPQPTNFAVWMNAHTAAMVHIAQLAQQVGADRFIVIGDEVQGLADGNANTAGWLSMIAQIRAVYSGQLSTEIYADGTIFAGGATHIDLIDRAVLDAVDLIGVGWFPEKLTNSESPSLAQLTAAWRNTARGIDTVAFMEGLHVRYNKPVWIADMAFHSFVGDNIRQSDIYNATIPLIADEQQQANEYESLFAVMSTGTGSWFLGISCDSWNRFPLDYRLTARFLNSEYGENYRGKAAAINIAEWFTGQRGWGGMKVGANSVGSNADIVVTGSLTVSPVDLGKTGNVYVAAALPNGSFYFYSNGVWTLATNGNYPIYSSGVLGTHSIPFLTHMNVTGFVGTSVLMGYGTDLNDLVQNRKYRVAYTVQ